MRRKGLCAFLSFVLILAAVRTGFAFQPGPAESRLEAATPLMASFSLPEDRQSRARLEVRSAVQRFRLVRGRTPAPVPVATARRLATEIDRRPPFHCRLPVPRSAAEDPAPH